MSKAFQFVPSRWLTSRASHEVSPSVGQLVTTNIALVFVARFVKPMNVSRVFGCHEVGEFGRMKKNPATITMTMIRMARAFFMENGIGSLRRAPDDRFVGDEKRACLGRRVTFDPPPPRQWM